ncbi:MAG: hypothetical protein FWD86_03140, partial [Firmicutes bacterium]|nr:hypothetical protein [Bacillota bacterium]
RKENYSKQGKTKRMTSAMIEFSGKTSDQSKKASKINGSMLSWALLLTAAVLIIAGCMAVWIINHDWVMFALAMLSIPALIWILCKRPQKISSLDQTLEYTIHINSDIVVIINKMFTSRIEVATSKVRKAKDMKSYYLLTFGLLGSGPWVCQKDLIVKGTIEDFERLFEGKIVRKYGKEKKRKL